MAYKMDGKGYRVPVATTVSQATMKRLNNYRGDGGAKLSRGVIIDKAVALLERTEKEGGAK